MDDEARRIEKQVALPATPQQVWEAIATGPGISAWYVPHEIFPGEGGLVSLGPGLDGRVLIWEEGERFAYGRFPRETPDQPDYLYDFRIAAVEDEEAESEDETEDETETGDADAEDADAEDADTEDADTDTAAEDEDEDDEPLTSVLTFVQTGFPEGEEWDAEYASFEQGWELFFGNLVAYLTHFPGQEAVSAVAGTSPEESAAEAWTTLLKGLELETEPAVGADVVLEPEGAEAITGTVDVLEPGKLLGVRSENGLHRFAVEGDEPCTVSIYHYLYGAESAEELDLDELTGDWQDWLDDIFAPDGFPDDDEDEDEEEDDDSVDLEDDAEKD